MPQPDFGAIAGLMGTLTLSFMCFYLYTLDRERFVGYWAVGWGLMAVTQVEQMIPEAPGIIKLINHVVTLASGLFIVWGTYHLLEKPLPRRWFWIFSAAMLLLVFLSFLQIEGVWASTLVSIILACTYFCTGVALVLLGSLKTRVARLSGASFLLWGLHTLLAPVLFRAGVNTNWNNAIDVMLGATSGLSFLMLYFDRVRMRMQQANQGLRESLEVARNAQSALLESEERFRLLFENTNEAIAVLDPEGYIQFLNVVAAEMLQGKPENFIDRNLSEVFPDAEAVQQIAAIQMACKTGQAVVREVQMTRGKLTRWFRSSIQPVRCENGQIQSVITISVDISERKRMEEALRNSEEKYRLVVENADEVIFIAQDDILKFFNSQTERLSGYSAAEIGSKPFLEFVHPDDRAMVMQRYQARLQGEVKHGRYTFRMIDRQDGVHWWEINPLLIEWEGRPATLNFARDISHERVAQQALEKERELARKYLDVAGVIMMALDAGGRVSMINPRGCQVLGREESEILGKDWVEHFIPVKQQGTVKKTFDQLFSGNLDMLEYGVNQVMDAAGNLRTIAWHNTLLRDETGRITGTLSSGEDVTERYRAEEALRESEMQMRMLFEHAPMGIITLDQSGKVIEANARSLDMLGVPTRDAFMGVNALSISNLAQAGLDEKFRLVLEEHQTQEFETWYTSSWGKTGYFWVRLLPRFNGRSEYAGAVLIFDDLSERQMGERVREAMVSVSTALRAASEKVEMYPIILDQVIQLMEMDGAYLGMRDPATGDIEVVLGFGVWEKDTGAHIPAGKGITHEVIRSRTPYFSNHVQEDPRIFIVHEPKPVRSAAILPLLAQDDIVGVLCAARQKDISEFEMRALTAIAETAASAIHRASLHEETRLRSRRLAALRSIDTAISTSFDLMPIFEVLLEAVETQLNVDATAIWTYNAPAQTIDFAQGRGFESQVLRRMNLRLGQSLTGQVAIGRRAIRVDNLADVQEETVQSLLDVERFVYYQGVPLIAKGEIKGVLEVYHHTFIDANREWQDFLNTLAGQAAIAIDNSELFTNLQVSNFDLSLAYDETLEGWARALELRDMETLGHSDRVTALTLRLAVEMGVDDANLVHIRRGSLLHDIGKMGIPDQILNKPGPLDAAEWQIMRQHPEHAYRMLAPIRYLRQALDIPYCHHEKWDGGGYPRGLRAKEIPLSARIFAIVDVWDALLSDRPYRLAWTADRALDFIRSESGKHFDPDVVEAFLGLMADKIHVPDSSERHSHSGSRSGS